MAAHGAKVLLITPPPLDEIKIGEADRAWGHPQATREAAVSARYSEAARQLAARLPGVVCVDLQAALLARAAELTPGYDAAAAGPPLGYPGGQRGALEQLLPDGLHMSGESYRVLFELVKEHIGPFPAAPEGWPLPSWIVLNPGTL